jgi:3-phosphoshikimate 1-carboxyvinyltransferase
MPAALALQLKPAAHAAGTVALPGSKSISNRMLLLAALAQGTTTLVDVLAADDTDRMLDALKALGVKVRADPAARAIPRDRCWWRISGARGEAVPGQRGHGVCVH